MKIGIVIYSKSGNTLLVAEALAKNLISLGHLASLEKLTAVDKKQVDVKKIVLESAPKLDGYDVVILGSPVHGFSLSPVMQAYLLQTSELAGKRVKGFVTQHFPYPWMGGSRALGQMMTACKAKGAHGENTGIVNWSSKHRDQRIQEVIDKLSAI